MWGSGIKLFRSSSVFSTNHWQRSPPLLEAPLPHFPACGSIPGGLLDIQPMHNGCAFVGLDLFSRRLQALSH